MNPILNPLVLAMLVAVSPLADAANAPVPSATVAPAARSAPVAIKAPTDWIMYDDTTYTPVADDVSRSLDAARKAFDADDATAAAANMRAVADELTLQADRASKEYKALEKGDEALLAADTQAARDGIKRLKAVALKASSAADKIESGKIKSKADLDKLIDKAARSDMERRWLVTDVATWYPVSQEPQRHFTDAVADYARQDYPAAAADIRKATSYLRLEAARASGSTRQELRGSIAQLDKLAFAVEAGSPKEQHAMSRDFAKASHALALEHRAKAAQSWTRKEYDKAGYELKAAAHGLESAAGWLGTEASSGASATVVATRELGDKLAAGAGWTREEVGKGFESLGDGLNALGRKIGDTRQAALVDVNA
ncbi:MAG: hypothetical protein ABI794_02725 [Betaproteobacteria bacterium]